MSASRAAQASEARLLIIKRPGREEKLGQIVMINKYRILRSSRIITFLRIIISRIATIPQHVGTNQTIRILVKQVSNMEK